MIGVMLGGSPNRPDTMNSIEATLVANRSVPLGPEKEGPRPLHGSRLERRIPGSSLSSVADVNVDDS